MFIGVSIDPFQTQILFGVKVIKIQQDSIVFSKFICRRTLPDNQQVAYYYVDQAERIR